MKYWIDVSNSPHVLFFDPVIKKLIAEGHQVEVTARDFASTVPLLNQKKISYKLIGKHGGKSRLGKLLNMIKREVGLFFYISRLDIDIALGHASYDSAIVSWLLRIPSVTTFDYEYAHTIHSILLKFVKSCIIPRYIPKDRIVPYGINKDRIHYFDGLKEHIYLHNFVPDKNAVAHFIDEKRINIIIRPPADVSEYYRGINQHLVYDVCDFLATENNNLYNIILTPRTPKQKSNFKTRYPQFIIPEEAFDGPQLMFWADYVFSSGGTMIREAAALGTKAISITDLRIGAVDQYLIDKGLLTLVETLDDFKNIRFQKSGTKEAQISNAAFHQYISYITSI